MYETRRYFYQIYEDSKIHIIRNEQMIPQERQLTELPLKRHLLMRMRCELTSLRTTDECKYVLKQKWIHRYETNPENTDEQVNLYVTNTETILNTENTKKAQHY